jgi:hypothetical protein
MVDFRTQNPNLGKFWSALDWEMLIYFMSIWIILRTWGISYNRLVHFSGFRIMYQEKSGNPDFQLFFFGGGTIHNMHT